MDGPVQIVLDVDSVGPIGGRVTLIEPDPVDGSCVNTRFDGWLGLLHVLFELTGDTGASPEERT